MKLTTENNWYSLKNWYPYEKSLMMIRHDNKSWNVNKCNEKEERY
jgi:hypothetical protein